MKFHTNSELGEKRKLTPEGFMVIQDVPIARIGDMDYMPDEIPGLDAAGGKIVMSRTADELFNPKTLASFEGKPFIIPKQGGHSYTVTPKTWRTQTIGHVQNVRQSGDVMIADIVVNDEIGIDQINNGLREISCGYEYKARQLAPGRGEQSEITGNHVAVVQKGRGGYGLRIGDNKSEGIVMEILDKIKNPALRLFGRAVVAGDEAAVKDIEKNLEKDEDEKKEKDDEKKEKTGDSMYVKSGDFDSFKSDVLAAIESLKPKPPEIKTVGDVEWQDVTSGAEILSPGIVLDRSKGAESAMTDALGKAQSVTVKTIIGDQRPDEVPKANIAYAFRAAVEVQKAANNAKKFAEKTGDASGFEPFTIDEKYR